MLRERRPHVARDGFAKTWRGWLVRRFEARLEQRPRSIRRERREVDRGRQRTNRTNRGLTGSKPLTCVCGSDPLLALLLAPLLLFADESLQALAKRINRGPN